MALDKMNIEQGIKFYGTDKWDDFVKASPMFGAAGPEETVMVIESAIQEKLNAEILGKAIGAVAKLKLNQTIQAEGLKVHLAGSRLATVLDEETGEIILVIDSNKSKSKTQTKRLGATRKGNCSTGAAVLWAVKNKKDIPGLIDIDAIRKEAKETSGLSQIDILFRDYYDSGAAQYMSEFGYPK